MSGSTNPRVTVLMAVYNGQAFLREAIESILNQSYADFELLIADDASTDRTPDIIRSYRDPRIRVVRNESNRGVAYTRNRALPLARGEYVAVLDADDVSYPHRLETQVAYLDAHPDVVLLGGSYEIIDDQGHVINTAHAQTDPLSIRWHLLFGNCIAQSTVMYRLPEVVELGGYDDRVFAGEDYDLYVRIAASRHMIAQLDEVLVQHREHSCSLDQVEPVEVKRHFVWTTGRSISDLVGLPVPYEVAECFRGHRQDVSPEVLHRAYGLTWTCLRTMAEKEVTERKGREKLFYAYLETLTRLVERYDMLHHQALGLALQCGLSYASVGLFSPRFAHFVYRASLPKATRRRINQVLFRRAESQDRHLADGGV